MQAGCALYQSDIDIDQTKWPIGHHRLSIHQRFLREVSAYAEAACDASSVNSLRRLLKTCLSACIQCSSAASIFHVLFCEECTRNGR